MQTRHGEVRTPVFMPVGTQATVPGQTVESLKATGARVLLANTYHLLLRPGPEVFRRLGGIHRFMNWDGPILTDSGGFQIFSLPHARAMNEDGARFQSYVDGTFHLLSPESSIDMQKAIGSDIMMVLDQCIPSTAPFEQAKAAMELTHRWAERSLQARGDSPQALFGIVQGACHADLRRQSAEFLRDRPFDGLAIGGLAVGETASERYEFTNLVTDHLPRGLPRYLMGVGTPLDMLEAVHRGVDMFDCIIPSQWAHRGVALTSRGKIQLRRTAYKFSEESLDAQCPCQTCRSYSRAYLHHLVKAEEALADYLLTCHNMTFYQRLMGEIREAIQRGGFLAYYEARRLELGQGDGDRPERPLKRGRVPRPARLGEYEVHQSPRGFSGIRHVASGEVMHSVNCPQEEANRLYVDQSQVSVRLQSAEPEARELVIWDVGLGAAFNAMAVVTCFERAAVQDVAPARRSLRLVSFERDLDSLRLAAKDPVRFPHLRHPAPFHILRHGRWEHPSGRLMWELCSGDFLNLFASAASPDLIFFDPFSLKTNAECWTIGTFSRLLACCPPTGTELYTYSAATSVRAALLASGFFVAAGVGTGPKSDTTIAFSREACARRHPSAPRLLGKEWLARWRRSESQFPRGMPVDEQGRFSERIENHPQFRAKESG
jgi:queuine tRNA-ribosyltransferase